MTAELPVTAAPVPGSWRDPASRVFTTETAVLRGLTPTGAADFDAVAATGAFRAAVDRGDIIDSWPADTASVPGEWAAVLGHRRIPVVTYPFEWSFSMLQDAARLHLELIQSLLVEGMWSKDASSYNVMFDGTRPVFIDVGSFQPVPDGESWPGYRQFCQTFLYPLLVEAHLGLPFQPMLRSAVDGIAPATADALFHGRSRWRRGVPVHVIAHARAERRFGARGREVATSLRDAGVGRRLLESLLARLGGVVDALEPLAADTAWSQYSDRHHYPPDALVAKERFVTDVLSARRRRQVLDLGCNDGRFARIAADHATHVVAADSDASVIDGLYRSLRDTGGPANVLPVVMSLTDPSPAIGWRGRERAAFADRVRPDLVLCLAVVHHLAVGAGVPLDEVLGYLSSFESDVVVEVPDRDDPMVQTLLGGRSGAAHHYDIDRFRAVAATHFTIAEELQLPGMSRTMFHLTRQSTARCGIPIGPR